MPSHRTIKKGGSSSSSNTSTKVKDKATAKHKKAMAYAQKGEISKAMATVSITTSLVTPSIQVVQNLQSKFPPSNQHMFSQDEIDSFNNFSPTVDDRIQVQAEPLRQIINGRDAMVRPAYDNLRYDHLNKF